MIIKEESDLAITSSDAELTEWDQEAVDYTDQMIASQDPVDKRLRGLIDFRQNHRWISNRDAVISLNKQRTQGRNIPSLGASISSLISQKWQKTEDCMLERPLDQ